MSKTKVIVRTHPHMHQASEYTILISDSLIRRWKIPTDQYITLRFGTARYSVRAMPIPGKNEIRLSQETASQLGLPSGGTTLRFIWRPASKVIRLGPLIGVMIPRIKGSPGRRFGVITAFCRELTEACKLEGAFVYFFTPDDVGSTSGKILGRTMAHPEYKTSFPIPDVIYNRLPSRKLDGEPKLQRFLREAKSSYNTSIFNEKYLDKTEVFEALKGHPAAARYLPESYAYRNLSQLKSMCAKYRTVFLKPVTGSLGKGIIRIARVQDGYQVSLSSLSGVSRQHYASVSGIAAALSGKLKAGKYQIQQGLDLISVSSRPVDFRALIQKNLTGQWVISSIVARIAGNNRFVSNIAQGGTISTVKQAVARSNIVTGGKNIYSSLRLAAARIAQGIEKNIPYHFGELGVDLAVDRNGKVWLLEVNSKPSKNDSSLLNETRHIRPSVKLLVQYFRHLAQL